MSAAYVTNATGAGAAAGLETLLSRMREEEVLAQRAQAQQQSAGLEQQRLDIDQQRVNQTGEYNSGMLANAKAQTDSIDAKRVADQANDTADRKFKMGIIQRIAGGSLNPTYPGEIPSPGEDMNNPEGRALMEHAGMAPNAIYGAPAAAEGPANLSPEETFYTQIAKAKGLKSYHELDSDTLAAARKKWTEEGRAPQRPEILVLTQDENTGQTVWTKRSQAAGMNAPRPAADRARIDAYRAASDLIDQIAMAPETAWNGIGPIAGPLGSAKMKYLGTGDPAAEQLRTNISQLKASTSFAEGGKQFTGTERQLLDNFLASIAANPAQARVRLPELQRQFRRQLSSMGVDHPAGVTGDDPAGPPKSADPMGDLYQQYLNRTKKGGQ